MPGLLLDMENPDPVQDKKPSYGFVVSHQKVVLDVDFATQSLTGHTDITILPLTNTLREVHLDARQCVIAPYSVKVEGEIASFSYEDPMRCLEIPKYIEWSANQYHLQQDRLMDFAQGGSLRIKFPGKVHVTEVDASENAPGFGRVLPRSLSVMVNGADPQSATPITTPRTAVEGASRFQPLVISIPFSIPNFRDGLHFVGLADNDARYPHVYTKHSPDPGTASCIFPCVDSPSMRCTWDISIRCSKTLGDAVKRKPLQTRKRDHSGKIRNSNAVTNGTNGNHEVHSPSAVDQHQVELSDDEKLLEMTVVCSGEQIAEVEDVEDNTKKTVSFLCSTIVAAQHIGFAIGPFEQVDLGLENREEDDEEKLAQGLALPVFGYCMPNRVDELRNTCLSVVHAADWLMMNGSSFPFTEVKIVFVDDMVREVEHTASLSICSNNLLYSPEIIDTERHTLRTLVHALASQWFGVSIIPEQPRDRWLTIGLSHFLTGLYMKVRMGNNDYLFRQKSNVDRLIKLDVDRPPLIVLGEILKLGTFEYDFVALKAELVLFIFDRRITKASGSVGLMRVMARIMSTANTSGEKESILSTETFKAKIDKITKYRYTEPFLQQWVFGAGCPRFQITQKFNKKKLCVEMKVTQTQGKIFTESSDPPALEKTEFLRLSKEEQNKVDAGELQRLFTGPLTIRVHEADGTPREHMVEVREGSTSFDVPYSTKYKRLQRTRRQKERTNAGMGGEGSAELGEEALYYCLGDVLQSPKDMKEWELYEWDEEMTERMEQENYEWVRVDADFEWICTMEFVAMPTYMYISQLQQDRDVVAHQEAMVYLRNEEPHPLLSTFLVRTLMDHRYFWGIRVMAAEILQKNAIASGGWIGLKHLEKAYQELFCYAGSKTPRPNDFSNFPLYFIMKAIPAAVAEIRGIDGNCPKAARHFILDQLRFNDNQQNDFSDNFKVASLLKALTSSIMPAKRDMTQIMFDDDEEDDPEPKDFTQIVVDELDRHRRMDEWLNSFQNIYTITVLKCKLKLMKAGIIPVEPMEFAKYLYDGTADKVRLTAFESLLDLGFITNPSVVAYLMRVMSTNNSPHLRNQLFEALSIGLATVAFGKGPEQPKTSSAMFDADGDALLIETEPVVNLDRKAHILRTTQIEGALAALKKDLSGDGAMKTSLWDAVKSTVIGAFEQANLLDVCAILFDPVDAMRIKLEYPRYYEAEKLGKAVVSFRKTERVRVKILNTNKYRKLEAAALPPISAPAPPPIAVPVPVPVSKPAILQVPTPRPSPKIVINSQSMAPPQKKHDHIAKKPEPQYKKPEPPHKKLEPPYKKPEMQEKKRPLAPPERKVSAAPETPRKKIIKIKVSGPKLESILSSPPKPATPRGKSKFATIPISPAPRPSPGPPLTSRPSPSPAPISTIAPGIKHIKTIKLVRRPEPVATSISTTTSTFMAPARKPLPSSAPSVAPNLPKKERKEKKSLIVKLRVPGLKVKAEPHS